MSIITPSSLLVSNFKMYLEHNALEARSMFGSQVIEVGVPVWRVSFQTPSARSLAASAVESLLDELRGKQNQLAIWHLALPAPSGTLRGTNTLHVSASRGATSVTFNCTSPIGSTLLKGDLIGFGSVYTQQVVRVTTDAVVDGFSRMTVNFYPPLRNDLAISAPVIWDKPRVLFRQETVHNGVNYLPGNNAEGIAVEMREDWRP